MITLQHHENYDGTGYPRGLKKDEILRCSKIARIIDVYDALTTDRPYAKAMRPFAALVEMKDNMLNCFDKELLVRFIRFFGPSDPRVKPRKGNKLQLARQEVDGNFFLLSKFQPSLFIASIFSLSPIFACEMASFSISIEVS